MKVENILNAFNFEAAIHLYKILFDVDITEDVMKDVVSVLWDEGIELIPQQEVDGTISLTVDECMYLNLTYTNGNIEKAELFLKIIPTELTEDEAAKINDNEIPNQTL